MLRAHRQAWCWQDEYHHLSMEDIRRLEYETQLHLAEKMSACKAVAGGGELSPTDRSSNNGLMSTKSASTSKCADPFDSEIIFGDREQSMSVRAECFLCGGHNGATDDPGHLGLAPCGVFQCPCFCCMLAPSLYLSIAVYVVHCIFRDLWIVRL